jgi:sugar phosphate isomerase/epimerase
MPTIGFCSISALDRPLAEAAALASRCGVDGIEVTGRAPHLAPDADLAAARDAGEAVRAAGLEVLAYGSYLSYAAPGSEKAAAREVACAEAMRAPRLRVWADHAGGAGEELRGDVVGLVRAAADAAAVIGIDVIVERHQGSLADTPERVEALLDAVDRPNVTLNYQVQDALLPAEVDGQPDDARRLVPRSSYFHVKNYRPADDPEGRLLFGGDLEHGVLDYTRILPAAVEAGYRGPYVIEFLSVDARPLEQKLADGVAFVRRVLAEAGAS